MEETRRIDLERAWPEREKEAALLRSAGFRSMAVNLRFYALEIRIKAIICGHLGLELLPKACKTHDLSDLLIFTGRYRELEDGARSDIKGSWDYLAGFSKQRLNDIRYLPDELSDEDNEALEIAFDDPTRGVIAWLSELP